ncbi:beta-glucosidase [Xylariomycetidae sp. FL0641]|nr:beta-glucosidase [Xylariomycetidae sp. FL0641]
MSLRTSFKLVLSLLAYGNGVWASPRGQSVSPNPSPEQYATTASPSWSYSSFTYETMSANRYATPLKSPLSQPTFAPPFSEASTLLPTTVTYTTYSLAPTASLTDDGRYGQSAYAALWEKLTFSRDPPFTTTVSPTPVPSSELVYPPPLPARAMNEDDSLQLPSDFVWGVAASAWQVEGALQLEGRGPADADTIGAVGSTGSNDSNIADMNYFLYKQDIARLAALGVPHYSFSISWSRVVPFGVAGSPINTQALKHYDDLINTCIEYGVTPVATLLHADHPAGILDNLTAFPDHFLYYAKQVMARYADRIPIWFTLNEPNIAVPYTLSDYNGLTAELLGHAKVYRWYKEELGGTARISTKFANNLAMPLDIADPADHEAARRYQEFILGIMGNPLFLGQQYPDAVLQTPGLNLTALTDAQIAYVHGTADFLAIDPYVGQFASAPPGGVAACAANASDPLWPQCAVLGSTQADGWLLGAPSASYPQLAPQTVRQQLGYLWNTFRPAGGIMITEFGLPAWGEAAMPAAYQRYDLARALYYANFLTEALRAARDDGVRVVGAFAWSWADNNEFGNYADHFGMQTVNRTDGTLERRFKRSFFDYVDFFRRHGST